MTKNKAFIGLSCTGHDGAVAILGGGQLVFAEAAERYRQSKFAVGQTPDDYHYCRDVFARYVDSDELVIAKSWSANAGQIWHDENRRLREAAAALPQHREILEKLAAFHLDNWDGFMGPSVDLAGHGTARAANVLGKRLVDQRGYDHHLCHAAFGVWGAPSIPRP